tara:strand:+ start:652 stop:1170 length:519 start_codon:yes stop_codon:yes gene_type:complete
MKTNYLLVLFAIGLAMTRLIPHPPNFTPIIAFAIISPVLFNNKIFGSVIVVLSMIISDIVIGFHQYQIVVYVSLLFISLLVPMNNNYKTLALSAFIASVWFFLVTNLAVWVAWDYYPKTFEGLIACYTLALPFFKNTLISTFIFTFLFSFSIKYILFLNKRVNLFFSKYLNI